MVYTIQNPYLTLTVDDLGAQMMSLTGSDGTEYLWNGDAAFWRNRAPNLFPYVGRSTEDACTIHGVRYPMSRHGFANRTRFTVESHGPDRITFTMTDSPEQSRFPKIQDIGLQKGLSSSCSMQFVNGRVKDLLEGNPDCAACAYRYQCGGGCRAHALAKSGQGLMGCDQDRCTVWKNGYADRIREAIRKAEEAYGAKA